MVGPRNGLATTSSKKRVSGASTPPFSKGPLHDDAGSTEYGVAFDRNGDGRTDLLVLNQGIAQARGAIVLPIAAILADDDFDGRIDGCVVENGDSDADGRADHRLFITDRDHDGKVDHAVRFEDAIVYQRPFDHSRA